MTNEELERAMQFVLEQQAQFVANQQQVSERVSRLETNMEVMAQAQAEMAQAQAETARSLAQLTKSQAQLAQEQARMAQTQNHMNEVVAALYEAQRHTEEKLDAFIGVLERYISEDRNGKGNGSRTN
jgi:sorbitol-specific phosphotransferase system component IIBC